VWPNDISAEFRAKAAATYTRYLAELAGFDRAALSPGEQMSYDTLKWTLTARLEGTRQFLLSDAGQPVQLPHAHLRPVRLRRFPASIQDGTGLSEFSQPGPRLWRVG